MSKNTTDNDPHLILDQGSQSFKTSTFEIVIYFIPNNRARYKSTYILASFPLTFYWYVMKYEKQYIINQLPWLWVHETVHNLLQLLSN